MRVYKDGSGKCTGEETGVEGGLRQEVGKMRVVTPGTVLSIDPRQEPREWNNGAE